MTSLGIPHTGGMKRVVERITGIYMYLVVAPQKTLNP